MANQISGRIYRIDPIVQIPTKSGESITKSSIIINTCSFDRYTGEKTYDDLYIKLDVMGKACGDLSHFNIWDEIVATYDLFGSKLFTTKDGVEDVVCHPRYISMRVVGAQRQTQAPIQQPAQKPQPTPQQQQPTLYRDEQTGQLFYYDKDGKAVWYNQ